MASKRNRPDIDILKNAPPGFDKPGHGPRINTNPNSSVDGKKTKEMIDQLEADPRLHKNEIEFLESVSDMYTNKGFLTMGQYHRLEIIYNRYNN